mmetsp:Transcript_35391/g.99422  ORF Transcript_35391/g.99422 Transcript_35391/m.99422 type:complete len:353 (+) Transcript_35391:62-1120(+)
MGAADTNGDDSISSPDLFRELKRLLPLAHLDQYYVCGTWKRKHLLVDIEIIKAHRKEAGAPEPLPVDEIPELAQLKLPPSSSRPPLSSTSRTSQAGPARTPPAAGRFAAVSGASREAGFSRYNTPKPPEAPPPRRIGQMKEFVTRWRMDPMRAMEMLSRLRPSVRLSVMENFRPSGAKMDPTEQLERHIWRAQGGSGATPRNGVRRATPAGDWRGDAGSYAPRSTPPPRPPTHWDSSRAAARAPWRTTSQALPPRPPAYKSSRTPVEAPSRPTNHAPREYPRAPPRARSPHQPAAGGVKRQKPVQQESLESGKRARVGSGAPARPSSSLDTNDEFGKAGAKPGDLIKNLLSW